MASILLGILAPDHRVRVIFDVGFVAIELFGLLTAVFGAVTLVLQEIESKTIYLLLTRPLSRFSYIVGRFLGLITAVFLTMGIMALIHIGTCVYEPTEFKIFLDTFDFWRIYPVVFIMIIGKMLMTTAIALFFSLFATSSVSALVFTGFFWVAGHFGTELSFIIGKTLTGFVAYLAKLISFLLPNYQYLNFRDTFAFQSFPSLQDLGWGLAYSISYSIFYLILSTTLFSKKEF